MPKPIVFERVYADDSFEQVSIPSKYEVCERCGGEGHRGNPAFDGLSVNYFHDDPEFAESYFEGHYDVCCDECGGDRVVRVPDEDACDPELMTAYYERLQALHDIEAVDRYWRRMESGGMY